MFLINHNGAGINAYVAPGSAIGIGGFRPLNGSWIGAFDPNTTKVTAGDFKADNFADVFLINHNRAGINAYVAPGSATGIGGLNMKPRFRVRLSLVFCWILFRAAPRECLLRHLGVVGSRGWSDGSARTGFHTGEIAPAPPTPWG